MGRVIHFLKILISSLGVSSILSYIKQEKKQFRIYGR